MLTGLVLVVLYPAVPVAQQESPAVPAPVSTAAADDRLARPLDAFASEDQRQLYESLLREYRCLKCQNQNLLDSHADLAGDLRREIRERVVAGAPRSEIDRYLVERYGEFVLYRPRFNASTWLLWLGPFALLALAIGYAWRLARPEASDAVSTLPGERLDEARSLLHAAGDDGEPDTRPGRT